MTTAEKIEELRRTADREWANSKEAMALSYDASEEIDRLQGDEVSAEFHAALAASSRAKDEAERTAAGDRVDRAYAALQARREQSRPRESAAE